MKLYKVRVWVNERTRKGDIVHPYNYEEVIVNDLLTAEHIYADQLAIARGFEPYGHEVRAELFTPHIFNGGRLAYWPDDNDYIKEYHTQFN
jgi:hypothetical protein